MKIIWKFRFFSGFVWLLPSWIWCPENSFLYQLALFCNWISWLYLASQIFLSRLDCLFWILSCTRGHYLHHRLKLYFSKIWGFCRRLLLRYTVKIHIVWECVFWSFKNEFCLFEGVSCKNFRSRFNRSCGGSHGKLIALQKSLVRLICLMIDSRRWMRNEGSLEWFQTILSFWVVFLEKEI